MATKEQNKKLLDQVNKLVRNQAKKEFIQKFVIHNYVEYCKKFKDESKAWTNIAVDADEIFEAIEIRVRAESNE